jgi:ribosomal protein S18 acetylase RimI-like enzyme
LPSQADIRVATSADINALRRINSLLLSVSYPDSFYKAVVDSPSSAPFSRVITWSQDGEEPKVVGGVVSRVEPKFAGSTDQTLYIRSLCLLAPYRSMGLMSAAVDNIVAAAAALPELHATTATAHVWIENEEGLEWYEKQGFKRVGQPLKGYYLKLRPDSAWLVERQVIAVTPEATPAGQTSTPTARSTEPSATAAVVNLPPMSAAPPSDRTGANPPPLRSGSGQSFQKQRPETEWNDLPADMATGRLVPPPSRTTSEPVSNASSRSSSAAPRKKRDRSYPAAAFGS